MAIRWVCRILMFFLIFFLIPFSFATESYSVSSGVHIDLGIKVLYDTFNGNTTDFLRIEDGQLAAITNMTLERTSFGKIVFTEIINLASYVEDNTVNLDAYVNISQNNISINTLHLPNLRKSADVSLYNLSFINPRVMMNGVVCSSSNCALISYLNGTLKFSVDEMPDNLTIEETPVIVAGSGGVTSLGNGGGRAPKIINFSAGDGLIDIKVKQGERNRTKLIILNNGDKDLLFTLKSDNLDKFIIIDESVFSLKAGGFKEVNIDFFASESQSPGIYAGRIFVNVFSMTKTINVIFEVIQKEAKFDVYSELDKDILIEGQKLNANIGLKNIGDFKKVDVVLEYFVKDFEGYEFKIGEETIGVERTANIHRKFKLPGQLPVNDYLFVVKATYGRDIASSANYFKLVKRTEQNKNVLNKNIILGILIIALLILAFFLFYQRKKRKLKKIVELQNREIEYVKENIKSGKMSIIEALAEIKKLKFLREVINESYKSDYISKKNYNVLITTNDKIMREIFNLFFYDK